ncbi:hypothetical protein [Paracidovorax sp. MALMAid1276]|uniref:hypothetical protein n=1 Tax=Paracidovorax sp. MALMAid1276 TaxID=3411631 RepID=UPI003B9C5F65
MTHTFARLISTAVLGAAVTGCATVPGDPYYDSTPYRVYEQAGYVYSTPQPTYVRPGYSTYPAYTTPPPAVIYYGGRDRPDDRWDRDHRHNNDWRERERDRAERDRLARERERDRAERDRMARERDRDRDRREQQAREADRRQREQAERDRRAYEAGRGRDTRPGHIAPGSYTPHPQDWRSRQFENGSEKP